MSPEFIAALGSAVAAVLTAAAVFVTAWRASRKVNDQNKQTAKDRKTTASKLETIHVLVNSRLSDALARIEKLEQALGIEPGEEPPPQ